MTQTQKGTFLQLPSVFIETCDLPETAQIMYIRMLHTFGYKGGYTGSLRKLAGIVRMSKSTVDRMLDVLARSHLISKGRTEASETAQSILQISLDPEYVWDANIDYCTTQTVPNWDTYKEGEEQEDKTECPKLGRAVPQTGQAVPRMGRPVPTRTLKQTPYITNTSKITKDSFVENTPSSLSANADEGVSFEEKEEKGRTNGNSPLAYSGVPQQYSDQPLLHPLQASGDTHGIARAQQETLIEDEEQGKGVGESQEKTPNAPTTDPSPDSQVTTPPTPDTLQPALLDAPTPVSIPASLSSTHTKDGCKISGTPATRQPERPKKPAPVLLCQPRAIRELIDANRGHSLEERGAIIHQNIVLKDWCAAHPLEHYYLVLEHLKSCRCKNPAHQWWHKEEHWRFLSAEKLAELTPGVLSELGKIPKPPPPEEARAGSISTVENIGPPVDKYVLEIRRRAAETAAYNAIVQGVAL